MDTHVVTTVDFLTSLVAGVVIFSMLGHTAHKLNIPMSEVAKGGQGLAFVAYPEVLFTKNDNSSIVVIGLLPSLISLNKYL